MTEPSPIEWILVYSVYTSFLGTTREEFPNLGNTPLYLSRKVLRRIFQELSKRIEPGEQAMIFENNGYLDYHPTWNTSSIPKIRLSEEEVAEIVCSDPELKSEFILNRMKGS